MTKISDDLKNRIRLQAKNRCGYCLVPQEIYPMPLEIEHINPQSLGGSDDEENLWLACRVCNGYKHAKVEGFDELLKINVALFNPRRQIWSEHFKFSSDQTNIIGISSTGRATIRALKLNHELSVGTRKNWVTAGWYPPQD